MRDTIESLDEDEIPFKRRNLEGLSQAELDDALLNAYTLSGEASVAAAYDALKAGADLNATFGPDGPNILFMAATYDKLDLFEWLCHVTKDGKKINVDYTMNDGSGYIASLLKSKVRTDVFEKFLESFDVDVNVMDSQGYTPLLKALDENNDKKVAVLLKNGANPNIAIKNGVVTPIIFASAECFADSAIPLIEAGADLTVIDKQGHNALMNALMREPMTLPKSKREGLLEMTKILVNHPDVEVNLKTESGIQPLFTVMRKEGYLEVFHTLISRGADVNAKYADGFAGRGEETPLHYAAKLENVECIKGLVFAGAKFSEKDSFGASPESYLLLSEDMRNLLLGLAIIDGVKFDVNALWGDKDKDNAFDAKAIKKQTVFKLLMMDLAFGERDEDPNEAQKCKTILQNTISYLYENGLNKTLKDQEELHSSEPLCVAISTGSKSLAKDLINSGELDMNYVFNFGNKYQKDQKNYLSFLFKDSNEGSLKALMRDAKSSLSSAKKTVMGKVRTGTKTEDEIKDIKDSLSKEKEKVNQQVEMKRAEIQKEKCEIFDLLLASGASMNARITEDGKTALFHIKDAFWLKEVQKRGYDIFAKDDNGYNPLDYAIIKNDKDVIAAYKELMPSVEDNQLYKLAFYDFPEYSNPDFKRSAYIKVALGAVNALYDSEVYEAYNKGKIESFPSNKAVSYLDEEGNSALLVAAANGREELGELFVKLGSNVNQVNVRGETALQYACANQMSKLAEVLLNAGADANVKNEQGFSAIDFANEFNLKNFLALVEAKKNEPITPKVNKPKM